MFKLPEIDFADDDEENDKELKPATTPMDQVDEAGLEAVDEEGANQPMFQLCATIPVCATLLDLKDEPVKQAMAIRDKFIPIKAEFAINISGTKRTPLLDLDFTALDADDLQHAFDNAYREVFRLLELDSFKRYTDKSTMSRAAMKLLKRIAKKKRRRRQRSKTREARYVKRQKQKQVRKKRAASSGSPALRSIGASPSAEFKPLGEDFKSISLSLEVENRAGRMDTLAISDTDMEETPDAPTPEAVFNEDELADPFNTLFRFDSVAEGVGQTSNIDKEAVENTNAQKCCFSL